MFGAGLDMEPPAGMTSRDWAMLESGIAWLTSLSCPPLHVKSFSGHVRGQGSAP